MSPRYVADHDTSAADRLEEMFEKVDFEEDDCDTQETLDEEYSDADAARDVRAERNAERRAFGHGSDYRFSTMRY